MITYYTLITKPFDMLITSDGTMVTGLYFQGQKNFPKLEKNWKYKSDLTIFQSTQTQLTEYVNDNRKTFDIPFCFIQGTKFQQKIWQLLLNISYGSIVSYSEFAKKISYPNCIRAVASNIGKNPISIIVPCHRVVGKNGQLTGYAAGLTMKKKLLGIEQKV